MKEIGVVSGKLPPREMSCQLFREIPPSPPPPPPPPPGKLTTFTVIGAYKKMQHKCFFLVKIHILIIWFP